jgi:nitrite reductase (NO-forming)
MLAGRAAAKRRWEPLVALVVSAVLLAACGGGSSGGGQPYKEPSGAARETMKIESGNFFFKPDKIRTAPGIVELELDNSEGQHTLVFDNGKVPGFQLEVGGATKQDAKKLRLERGKYTFYCDIPGHRAQGMEGTITVG